MTTAHKQFAKKLTAHLASHGYSLRHGHALECVASLYNLPNWDTLAARPGTVRLSAPADAQALQRALQGYGIPLEESVVRDLIATLLPPQSTPQVVYQPLLNHQGLQVLPVTENTLAPWPLLPIQAEVEESVFNRLAFVTSLSWQKGKTLRGNGSFIHLPGLLDEHGECITAWTEQLRDAIRGTSHYLGVTYDGQGAVYSAYLRRGLAAPPQPAPLPLHASLHVIYGRPGSNRSQRVLQLAYSAAKLRRVYLIDSPELLGNAGEALKGPCTLVPQTRHGFEAMLQALRPGDFVALQLFQTPEIQELCQHLIREEVNVIAAIHATSRTVDDYLSLYTLPDDDIDFYEVDEQGDTISKYSVRSDFESDEP